MKNNKHIVLRRYPKAVCYMSQLSGMFFVKNKGRILAYTPSANASWKQAADKTYSPSR